MSYNNTPKYINYDKLFAANPDKKRFYSDYPGAKLVTGTIGCKNARARAEQGEYYVLVTYHEGEELPNHYKPLPSLTSEDGTMFATVAPDRNCSLDYICINGGIQMISDLTFEGNTDRTFLRGPGPDKLLLSDLIMIQYTGHCEANSINPGKQMVKTPFGAGIKVN